MFYDHERFQTHCRKCFRVFEADSVEEVLREVEEHEEKCVRKEVKVDVA